MTMQKRIAQTIVKDGLAVISEPFLKVHHTTYEINA
jgi:hypothetical protein